MYIYAEIDRAKLDWKHTLGSYGINTNKFIECEKINIYWIEFINVKFTKSFLSVSFSMLPSSVMIFFREQEVVAIQRTALYTYTDFLAICGGLLGLLLGVSALSVIEFIYYSTLRLYWTLRGLKANNTVVPVNRNLISHIPFDTSKNYAHQHRHYHRRRF